MIRKADMRTPVQEITWAEAGDNRIFLKRDDLLPYSFGGNKVRIGLAFFEDMKKRGGDAMIMYGSPRSNLCRVLASMCCESGIPAVMVSSEEDSEEPVHSFNAAITGHLGTVVLPCSKKEIAETVDRAFSLLRKEGRNPYYIYGDRTGTGNEAAAASAYSEAYDEILEDQNRLQVSFDYLYTPYGTGATMGGLISGAVRHASLKQNPYIVGISISSRSPERASDVLTRTVSASLAEQKLAFPDAPDRFFRLESRYNAGGYGLYNDEIEETIRKMLSRNSVPLDPTYTGKAFLGMIRDLRERNVKGKNILYLHTGGLPLFFDYLNFDHESAG